MLDNSKPCPVCEGTMIEIVYGHPDDESRLQASKGEVVLGGCIIQEGQPTHVCNKCGLSARLIEHIPNHLIN
jgi:hypothetical protein